MIKAIGTVLFLGLVTGCSQLEEQRKLTPSQENREAVYGFSVKENKLWFQVMSNGCTTAKSFSLLKQVLADGRWQVMLIREKKDHCRALPRLIPVELALDDAGVKPIVLVNSFVKKPSRSSLRK